MLPPCRQRMLAGGTEDKEHAMSQKLDTSPAVIGIDIGKNSFHIVGQNQRGAIVLRQTSIGSSSESWEPKTAPISLALSCRWRSRSAAS